MMVIFVSESQKKAIKTTNRVLDAFANRIGESTWQTLITKEGLDTVHRLLKQSASKSTSVSCHWIRSRQISELLWIVGNKNKFNEEGNIAVNSTNRKIIQHYKESGWPFLPLVQTLTAVAALMHDLGKASVYFQEKLQKLSCSADPFRHEFISALLIKGMFHYFADQGLDLWTELASGNIPQTADLLRYCRDYEKEKAPQYKPFKGQSSIVLSSIVWLVLSHHRLPLPVNSQGDSVSKNDFSDKVETISQLMSYVTSGYTYRRTNKNSNDIKQFEEDLNQCFNFKYDFSSFSEKWRSDLKKWCRRLLEISPDIEKFSEDGTLRIVLKNARLSLMLGDHFYSSLDSDSKWKSACTLYANTDRKQGTFRQKLDEHLCGVKNIALKVSHYLPALENGLPRTKIIQALKHKSKSKYIWQDQATENIKKFRLTNPDVTGGFILNLASTGCGKTTANAKIAAALGPEPGTLRFTLALGLRTLTLQTGDEYRYRLHLTKEELAVVIGSSSVQYIHEQERLQKQNENSDKDIFGGSESLEDLFEENIFFEGELPYEGFATLFERKSSSKMLYAPVLCCTIDQIIGATECTRGGRYMLPFLRMMSSDLIIDEVDDFTGKDLKAIGRLIHLCGTLGKRVVLSSATLPPEIANSYFRAYKEGFKSYCRAREINPEIMVAWINENKSCVEKFNCESKFQEPPYRILHEKFIKSQREILKKAVPLRIGYICECPIQSDDSDNYEIRSQVYFGNMVQAALNLHHNHHLYDTESGKEISFGVIRFANIDPCVAFAKYLCKCALPQNTEVKVMVYHSRQTLLMRHEQEFYLDNILNRHGENPRTPAILNDSLIRKHINTTLATKLIFLVICTPAEEVGRDHDYDWALIEPSSWRSIIQMSGRVNRHRYMEINTPNIGIM
jgi:CRISPR-associated endonuclease/helicase Cas3